MFRNPSPPKEPYRPSREELDMLEQYHINLYQHCPRTKYGFLGTPCPSESIMMQLNLKRHKLRNTIDQFSRKDRLFQAEIDRVELAKQDRINRLVIEGRDKRKDSATCSEVSKGSDASRDPDVNALDSLRGSAIYDTDDNKEQKEEDENYDEDDDQYYTEEEDCEGNSENGDHISISHASCHTSTQTSTTSTPDLVLAITPETLEHHTLSKTFMYSHRAAYHDLRDPLATPPDLHWTLPQDFPVRDRSRHIPRSAPLRRSSKSQCLRQMVRDEKDGMEELEKWKMEWRARWYKVPLDI